MESSQQQQRNHHNQSQPDLHQQHHTPTRPPLHTSLTHIPLLPLRSASSTPMSSHGLFNPSALRHSGGQASSLFDNNAPTSEPNTVHLHPLQSHQVRETHKALIDNNNASGRKSINQYEVIEEIGRGMSGKVKLARNTDTGDNVAIKIIPRFSKKRRLGKVTALSPQDKTKKEIAILKKIRHPNVVALLEVIDDPELKKIYMVLEHVELGEIVWRKKGLPHICNYERKRTEREMRGEAPTSEEEQYDQMLERRQALREFKRRRMVQNCVDASEPWSVEHGAADDATNSSGPASRVASKEDFTTSGVSPSASAMASTAITTAAAATTRTTTTATTAAIAMAAQPICRRPSITPSQPYSCSSSPGRFSAQDDFNDWNEDSVTPGPFQQQPMSAGPFDNSMLAAFMGEDFCFRGRAPSNADSVISHMSSVADNMRAHDPFADDFSYVPCFTFDQARSAFRDTVLGLEFLHYQGVVHRDIKPANLLWSKDHRVKISDFGVSYFGRPIRDGESDELIPESEAKDFDDDLELSKTVGTPAFFAPELCHTDLDKEQPKVSEQIDVWSLGVTLYCLIFARIPFLAEDEFQMFRKIAREDVYIPRRRLKPVDPSTSPTATSLFKRQNSHPYRDDNVLEHEEVDDQLLDLLVQMLTKNPEQRIRLRDIKRHPWVLQGLSNPVSWLEDTDPARRTSGHKIQVDEKEMSSAVVPLTFLERARSVVKKAVGKVMQPLMDREGSRSRRRAASSAASSVGDSMFKNAPAMPQSHNDRLRSLHPNDDFLGDATQDNTPGEGAPPFSPLVSGGGGGSGTQPAGAAYDPMATVLPLRPGNVGMGTHSRSGSDTVREEDGRPVFFPSSRASHRPGQQQGSQQFLRLTPIVSGPHPSSDEWALHDDHEDGYRREVDATTARRQGASSPLSQFMDRCLFSSPDKRGSPRVSLDMTAAHGSTHASRHVRAMHSVDFGVRRKDSYSLSTSPLSASPHSLSSSYQHRQPQSDPNFRGQLQGRADGRPVTAHRVDLGDGTDKEASGSSVPGRRPRMQTAAESATIPCPLPLSQPTRPSWCGEHAEPISRGETMASVKTASSGSIDRLVTPLTTPSEAASLMAAFPPSKDIAHHIAAYQSDPSLPALLSGASSVSADLEGELLGRPGILGAQASLLETTESLTPPALAKEPGTSEVAMHLESREGRRIDEEEDDENSDDGVLLMVTARKRPPTVSKGPPFAVRRRDTNFSTASDETARRVVVDDVVDEDEET